MIEILTPDRVADLKRSATERIRVGLASAAMRKVDKVDKLIGGHRLRDYLKDLTRGDKHNMYEQLEGTRFFELMERYDFKPSRVARVVVLFESLPMPSSNGRNYTKCSACQVFEFSRIYGFYHADSGLRLTTDVLLFVPRKYGKTTMCAVLALVDVLFGDCDAEAYISSNQYQQSQICFKSISKMLRMLDRSGHFHFTRDTIDIHLPKRESLIRCLPYSPDKLDGLKASVAITDEFAQADSADQKNVIASSMGTRSEPLVIDITTASAKTESPFVEELEAFKRILRGEAKGDNVFAHIFEPDLGDDPFDEATWYKVHPHLGVTVNIDFYRRQAEAAKRGYDNMREFLTKLLNIFVYGEEKSWYEAKTIIELSQPFTLQSLGEKIGRPYGVAAVDLSVSGDLSAVTYFIYDTTGLHFYSKTHYYLPENSLGQNMLYADWVEKGHLTLMPGSVIDPVKIAEDVIKANDEMVILKIGFDPYKSKDFVNTITAYGGEKALSPVRQVISNFTSSVGTMAKLIDRQGITFDSNPITPWCFQNAVLAEDANGNCKPMKRNNDSPQKIDGCITNLMGLILLAELGIC